MPQEGIKIELGGFCAQVTSENQAIIDNINEQFHGFTSKDTPSFTIKFTDRPGATDVPPSRSLFNSRTSLNSMRIVRRGGRFLIHAEHPDHNHTTRQMFDVGIIDIKKKTCRLYSDPKLTSKALISPTILSCFQLFLLNANGFILHASAVAKKSRAFVFSGPSGSGKSTVARRRRGGNVLADDLICVRRHGNHFLAYGTPWHSKHRHRPARIKRIFFLKHAGSTSFEDMTSGSATHELLANISMNVTDRIIQEKLLKTLSKLTTERLCSRMRFSLHDPFWKLLEEKYPEKQQ